MIETDPETIQRAKRGDHTAFKAIYDLYAPFVWKVVYRTTNGNHDSAAEVMQEAFIRVHKSIRRYDAKSRLSTWIYRIAYNAALTHHSRRRDRREQEMQPDQAGVEPGVDARVADRDLIHRIMSALSAEERFLLTAREVTGLSFEELASVTGKNEGALRTSLHRLKERIKGEFHYAE